MARGILIYAEVMRNGYINTVFWELVTKARELSKKLDNAPIMGVLFTQTGDFDRLKDGFNGLDKVFVFENEIFKNYSTENYAKLMVDLINEIEPEIVLIGATNQGRDLAPRISSMLHTGLTADCTELDINENAQLAATRPTFGGQLMATILCKKYPQMATVRPNIFRSNLNDNNKKPEIVKKSIPDIINNLELLKFIEKIEDTKNELESAEIIVAGGKGLKSKEGFKLLKELADKLGGTVGASRGAVDMGYAPQSIQIGQTGKTVSPRIYIACGISGAIQHTCGLTNVDYIFSINRDKNAAIFDISDYCIVGDVFDVIPKLIEKF